MRVDVIIPSRYYSNRLPGKPLKIINGKTMIEHVYNRSKKAQKVDNVLVATDDKRIYDEVIKFGGKVFMTSKEHQTGTDRIAEVAKTLESDLIVNVQGDEPLIDPKMIDQAISPFKNNNELQMATLKHKINDEEAIKNLNNVKVITDNNDFALYFSRSPIPSLYNELTFNYFQHVGLYVYRRKFLIKFSKLKPTPLEKKEKLEQLRALEYGYRIKVIETNYKSIGVDTLKDLNKVRELFN